MGWICLLFVILLEVSGTTCMKLSEGFAKTLPFALLFVFCILSFIAITFSLKTINVNVAYAIWSGAGTVFIMVIKFVKFKEPITTVNIISVPCRFAHGKHQLKNKFSEV